MINSFILEARGQPHMLLGPNWLQALVNGNGSSGTTPLMRGTFQKKQKTKSVSSNVNSLITVCLLKYYWGFVSELKKINFHPSRTVLGVHEHSIPRFSGLHESSSIGTFCSCPLLMISYKKERVPLNVMLGLVGQHLVVCRAVVGLGTRFGELFYL